LLIPAGTQADWLAQYLGNRN
jgi:hypothetical protein